MPDPQYGTPPPALPPAFFPRPAPPPLSAETAPLPPPAPPPPLAAPDESGDRPADWDDVVKAMAKKYQIDPRLGLAVARTESLRNGGLDPNAASGAGAHGIMQLMPATAARHKVNVNDPVDVVRGGMEELRDLLAEHHGDVTMALRRYNGSPQASDAATDPYVAKVMEHLQALQAEGGGATTTTQQPQTTAQPAAAAAPAQPPHAQTLWERMTGTTSAVPADVQAEMDATGKRTAPPPPPAPTPAEAPGDWAKKENIEAAVGASQSNAPPEPWWARGIEATRRGVSDTILGAAKSAGQTALRVGGAGVDLAAGAPGLSQTALNEVAPEVQPALEPHGAMQHVGQFGEQVAELWAPSEMLAELSAKTAAMMAPRLAPYVGQTLGRVLPKMVVEGVGGGVMAGAQGGDVKTGAILGAAAAPIIAGASAAKGGISDYLEGRATKLMTQALDPRKERFKAIAKRIIPRMLQDGVWGSREHLAELSAEKMLDVGQRLDAHLQQVGQDRIFTKPVWDAIKDAKDAFRTSVIDRKTGLPKWVNYDERAVKQLDDLQNIIRDLGKTTTVEKMIAVRQVWDKVVDQAGGFAHRVGGAIGVPLADATEAAAKRTADGIIRKNLARLYPERVPLNQDYSFWKNLNGVVEQTMDRTMPHGPGMGRTAAKMLWQGLAAFGGAHYGGMGAVFPTAYLAGKVGEAIEHIVTSPSFRSGGAVARDRLAKMLAAGDFDQLARLAAEVGIVAGSKTGGGPPAPTDIALPPPAPPR